ncbi:MAG: hypothetical protein V4546_02865 [Bacteroidota bacterium]|uniref:Uncharacterized protein n=1 Tax=Pedobacter cryotolerans TaxID=2571270 RepID=A0A4U1BWE8_9SPHI|nr:hypothetical protein [Pedobacter cryotolerans]TKB97229.1 hypothetical protein FA045_16870 [Pedobacter cryotolerans]
MEAYKFKAKVSENGTITIPESFGIKNREIEVIILNEVAPSVERKSMKSFLEKYSGVLKGVDPDHLKWDYLKEKHGL